MQLTKAETSKTLTDEQYSSIAAIYHFRCGEIKREFGFVPIIGTREHEIMTIDAMKTAINLYEKYKNE